MSERYTVQENDDALWIYDGDDSMDPGDIAALLNDRDRLAAQVATLRELLRDSLPSVQLWHGYINRNGIIGQEHVSKILDRIDAALATSGETP